MGRKNNPDSLFAVIESDCRNPERRLRLDTNQLKWCKEYWSGATSSRFPLDAVLEHESLRLTVFLAVPELLQEALNERVECKLGIMVGDRVNNALGATAAAALGLDLQGMADKIIKGLVIALETRAQQEAASVVLEQFASRICNDLGPQSARYLERTCRLAKTPDAFNGSISSGGLSPLQFLRHTLIEDLRHMPGVFAYQLMEKAAGLESAAPATENLVNALAVQGMHPFKALERFAMETDPITQKKVRILSCLADFTPSLLRNGSLVEMSARGDTISLENKNAAVLGLALWNTPCDWTLVKGADNPGKPEKIKALAALHSKLEAESYTISRFRADLEVLKEKPESTAAFREIAGQALALAGHTLGLLRKLDQDNDVLYARAAVAVERYHDLLDAAVSARAGEFGEAWAKLLSLGCDGGKANVCLDMDGNTLKYAGLIVSIAEADSASQVSDALLAAASPVGSWKEKYDPKQECCLVGFGGTLGIGGEWVQAAKVRDRKQPAIIGSIGLDIVLLRRRLLYLGGTAQILDLGAYLKPEKSGLQGPRPLQVLSPGAGLKVGLGGLPLAWVTVIAYDFDSGIPLSGSRVPKRGARFFSSLGVDVPLFSFR